ncbi:hypothetical protein HanPI659440_Chr06g0251011 [Helianthus annuus]|nr:hypothetical protein HanPI659440_Chr06g0251011 [Helianthus annuus]
MTIHTYHRTRFSQYITTIARIRFVFFSFLPKTSCLKSYITTNIVNKNHYYLHSYLYFLFLFLFIYLFIYFFCLHLYTYLHIYVITQNLCILRLHPYSQLYIYFLLIFTTNFKQLTNALYPIIHDENSFLIRYFRIPNSYAILILIIIIRSIVHPYTSIILRCLKLQSLNFKQSSLVCKNPFGPFS